MPLGVAMILSFIGVIAAVIYIYKNIMDEEKCKNLHPVCMKLHNLFNFKTLWLEEMLKFLYVVATTACVVYGVFLLLTVQRMFWSTQYFGGYGLLLIVCGPIAVRLSYEILMMPVLLLKNVMQINSRMGSAEKEDTETATPVVEEPAAEAEVVAEEISNSAAL